MKWPEFKTYKIHMENREDFNKVSEWAMDEAFNVVDIGHSDMVLVFDNEEDRDDFSDMIIMNHMDVVDVVEEE